MGVLHYADQFGHNRHLVVHGKGGSLPPGLVALAVGEGVLVGDVVRAPPLGGMMQSRAGMVKNSGNGGNRGNSGHSGKCGKCGHNGNSGQSEKVDKVKQLKTVKQ